ncbi:MAG: DUF192 domain-containing protein [Plectolyngbya sp. WJT66-NPBG17]|jgi:hypothetical protein|nr:DUF192 domain-containing protein [Plectolyngbya sp. WJT66-NPBG17]MBW4527469.1 DUF192 domain-containing protein [Phormidium tanganyikae FI6-MK23]
MKYQAVCLSLGLLLASCSAIEAKSTPSSTVVQPSAPAAITPSNSRMGQILPLTASFNVANQVIRLEVAKMPDEQAMGLMYRTGLADDRGMLFPFNPPRPTQFWMKNTLIPLDMLFLRKGKIRSITANVPPCQADPCPTYGSPTEDIDQVIELRAGRAAELGLKVGDFISIQPIRN